jgi:hypothetical protein
MDTGIGPTGCERMLSIVTSSHEGEQKCRNFVNSALSVGQSVSFYSPISKSKLITFEHMNAKTSLKCKSGEIITGHINPEIVFRRALVLANSRDDVTIDNILSHPKNWGNFSFELLH